MAMWFCCQPGCYQGLICEGRVGAFRCSAFSRAVLMDNMWQQRIDTRCQSLDTKRYGMHICGALIDFFLGLHGRRRRVENGLSILVCDVWDKSRYNIGKAYNIRCFNEEQMLKKHLITYAAVVSNIRYRV